MGRYNKSKKILDLTSSTTPALVTAAYKSSNEAGVAYGATVGTVAMARPQGTLNLTRKTALAQRMLGLLETGETFLSTNPGTQIEVAGFPWGTNASAPGTLNALVGQVVPSGQLIQGLPEV